MALFKTIVKALALNIYNIIFSFFFLFRYFPGKSFILLDDESPTSTNLGNDHEFIIKEYSLH